MEHINMQRRRLRASVLVKQLEKPLDSWYLIDNEWFKKLKKYWGIEDTLIDTNPGPIDNKSLFRENG